MKHWIYLPGYLIILLLISKPIFGQSISKRIALEDKEFNKYFLNKTNIHKVKGKLINLTKEEISKIQIEYSVVTPFEQFQVKNNCSLKADGSFELKLENALPYQQLWISFDTLFYAGVYVNADLVIELDAAILKTQKDLMFNGPGVKYLGPDGRMNEYTNNHILFRRTEQLEIGNKIQRILPIAGTDYNEFIKKYDSLYSILNELDNDYINQHPSEFSWILKNERQSNYFSDLCYVHWNKQMSPELFEKVKTYKPYVTANFGMLFYRNLVFYLKFLAFKKQSNNKDSFNLVKSISQVLAAFDSLFLPSKSDLLKLQLSSKDPEIERVIKETVLRNMKTPWCKEVIKSEYNNTLKKLATINKILKESKPIVSHNQLGEPVAELPFGARLYKIEGIKADSLLSMIVNSFKNKAVLIDLWATWCAPCIKELPYSEKLHMNSKDLPIEFVYLCSSDGSDIKKWKSKIAEYKLSGTHIFIDKKIANGLMNLFSFSGYPAYMLINIKGEYKPGVDRPSRLNRVRLAELIK